MPAGLAGNEKRARAGGPGRTPGGLDPLRARAGAPCMDRRMGLLTGTRNPGPAWAGGTVFAGSGGRARRLEEGETGGGQKEGAGHGVAAGPGGARHGSRRLSCARWCRSGLSPVQSQIDISPRNGTVMGHHTRCAAGLAMVFSASFCQLSADREGNAGARYSPDFNTASPTGPAAAMGYRRAGLGNHWPPVRQRLKPFSTGSAAPPAPRPCSTP